MKIYNTLTKQLEEFKPIETSNKPSPNTVNFFVCGPTVYDFPHLGHAKAYIQFDFIVKYLRSKGYNVFYLMNITDIEDRIIARSTEKSVTWKDLTTEYSQYFYEDMNALHVNSITKYALAADHIDAIVKQVKTLLEKGYAYKTSDGIYFEISKFPDYGKLSGRTELQESDGVSRVDTSQEKRGWNDFCLWKNYKEGEPFWETEIGKGRPGWHIEDTAITETFFGPQYDIHGGGADLIFPHHEAEITQMESASGKSPLAKYWMHIGFLNINSKKMGKSMGNFLTIRDVLKKYDYRTLRFFFLSSHYKSQIDFTEEALESAKNAIKRFDEFLFKLDKESQNETEEGKIENLRKKVTESLDEDFNTPKAFGHIFDYIKEANQTGLIGKATYEYFLELDKFFDFLFEKNRVEETDEKIEELVKRRDKYRLEKNFEKADEIRKELENLGVQVYDSDHETKWRRV